MLTRGAQGPGRTHSLFVSLVPEDPSFGYLYSFIVVRAARSRTATSRLPDWSIRTRKVVRPGCLRTSANKRQLLTAKPIVATSYNDRCNLLVRPEKDTQEDRGSADPGVLAEFRHRVPHTHWADRRDTSCRHNPAGERDEFCGSCVLISRVHLTFMNPH